MADRNFDDIADKFSRNIYDTPKGKIRQAILWQDLEQLFSRLPPRPLRILDAGGGEGHLSCRLAQLGHQVILCDISEKMLARAEVLAKEEGVSQLIEFKHCSAQDVGQYLPQPVDLILFHAVLEWISEPQQALKALNSYLTPGGVLSLMFYNYNGLLFKNIQLGNFPYIDAGMRKKKRRTLSPDNPLEPQQVYRWLDQLKLVSLGKSGVRVFYDYLLHGHLHDKPLDFTALLALEMRHCRQEPFVSLGRYIHVMVQKPNEKDLL